MKALMAFGLLLVAILVTPTTSLAFEALGPRHVITCFQCGPDIIESFHIARSTGAAAVILQTQVYDTNGIDVGHDVIADPAGTFLTQQVVFKTSEVLTRLSLPAGLYSAVLVETTVGQTILYEQIALNLAGVVGILTGRGTNLPGPGQIPYNYTNGAVRALTIVPETQFNVTNQFVCNNPANNMATFLGIAGPASGAQGVAQLITAAGSVVLNTFTTQSTFSRALSVITPAGPAGGSLFLVPPGATLLACVRFIRITGGQTVGGYTYQ